MELNGKDYQNTFINYDDIQNGGEIIFNMSATPNTNLGTKAENKPYSLSTENNKK